jgi:hypothetical protein
MSDRFELRNRYIEGWYEMDGEKLLSTTTENFIFEDPAESAPVPKNDLVAYMHRWDERTRLCGATNHWILENEVRQDRGGVLIDWEWWELVGSDICGMAFVKTSDTGVYIEKITYFDRKLRQCNHES